MPRVQQALKPVRVKYICDECGEGEYRPKEKLLLSDPPQFPHACNQCGDETTLSEQYPTIRFCLEGELLDLENFELQTSDDSKISVALA